MEKYVKSGCGACVEANDLAKIKNLLVEDTYINQDGEIVIFEDSELFHIVSDMLIKNNRGHTNYRIYK
jgi:hypothetical protein